MLGKWLAYRKQSVSIFRRFPTLKLEQCSYKVRTKAIQKRTVTGTSRDRISAVTGLIGFTTFRTIVCEHTITKWTRGVI